MRVPLHHHRAWQSVMIPLNGGGVGPGMSITHMRLPLLRSSFTTVCTKEFGMGMVIVGSITVRTSTPTSTSVSIPIQPRLLVRNTFPVLQLARSFRTSVEFWHPQQQGPTNNNDRQPEEKTKIISKLAKKALPSTPHENIYNLPNFLTASRLIASPVIGYLILHDQNAFALGLLVTAGITDLVDGWLARRWGLQTVVGSVIDPMADKALMTILTVTLAIKGLLPVWLATIILGRDLGLMISAIYYRYISLPPPKTFMRYWDFSLPSAEVKPTTISKINTVLQLGLIAACTAHPVIGINETALTAAEYIVAATTIWSGLSYIGGGGTRILPQPGQDVSNPELRQEKERKDGKGKL